MHEVDMHMKYGLVKSLLDAGHHHQLFVTPTQPSPALSLEAQGETAQVSAMLPAEADRECGAPQAARHLFTDLR